MSASPEIRRFTFPWLTVAIAAFAMVATLPGRTHGLGLITEPLLADLHLDRLDYAAINLWATLLGAAFCLPWGWLIDRLGVGVMLAVTLASLGAVVIAMGRISSPITSSGSWGIFGTDLFLLVLLTRGFGQSALSVVSITMIGRIGGHARGLAVGVYSFLVAVGFMASFGAVKTVMETWEPGWRELWSGIGWVVLGSAPIFWLLARAPEPRISPLRDQREESCSGAEAQADFSLIQALRSPVFWVFATGTSLYGLIAAGISLFNQSLLEERNFDRGVFYNITTLTPLVGLLANLGAGWLSTRWPVGRVLALAMFILTGALLCFPFLETLTHVYLYATAMGIAGGIVTVVFFAVWGMVFGKTHLGQIQGAAQMLTVLASAIGPVLFALSKERTDSYVPLMSGLAVASALLGLAAWCVPLPKPRTVVCPAEAVA